VLDGLDARPQGLGGVAGLDRDALGRDHRPRVDPVVDVVDRRRRLRDARGEDVLDRVRARKIGEGRGVGVDDPAAEAVEEGVPQQVNEAGADDELDATLLELGGHRLVAPLAALVPRDIEHARRDPRRLGPRECAHARLVGGDRGEWKLAVDQRLQVRALAADEHPDHRIRPITSSPGCGSDTTAQ